MGELSMRKRSYAHRRFARRNRKSFCEQFIEDFVAEHGERPDIVPSKLHGSPASRGRAWNKFLLHADQPISATPPNETPLEARVRVLTDLLARCKLFDATGLRFVMENGCWEDSWWIQGRVKAQLADAVRALRFERGQF